MRLWWYSEAYPGPYSIWYGAVCDISKRLLADDWCREELLFGCSGVFGYTPIFV